MSAGSWESRRAAHLLTSCIKPDRCRLEVAFALRKLALVNMRQTAIVCQWRKACGTFAQVLHL